MLLNYGFFVCFPNFDWEIFQEDFLVSQWCPKHVRTSVVHSVRLVLILYFFYDSTHRVICLLYLLHPWLYFKYHQQAYFLIFREDLSCKVLDGLPWNLAQMLIVALLSCHHEVSICGFQWIVSTTTGWIALSSDTVIPIPLRKIYNRFADPRTFI